MAEIIRIDEHTWRMEDGFVRFFLLEGEEKSVLLDSGVSCPNAAELARELTDKPVILLNTHGDGDHTSGTAGFAEIYMHPDDYEACGVSERYPGTALHAVKDGDVLELGGRTLKLIHIPGHTKGSIAVLDVRNRVLYAGDSVQKGHIYMFGDKRVPDRYEDSLVKLMKLESEYDSIRPSHDEWSVPKDYAGLVREAWRQVQAGKVSPETADLFGNKVCSYTTAVCGFYL